MYAIIETGGKQYRVRQGDTFCIDKIPAAAGETVEIARVLAVAKEDGLQVGAPLVDGARVLLKVLRHGKERKIIVYKYKAKKNYRRKQGHRQLFTQVKVEEIMV
ncbi:MAG: 50S ribosomal protein L21 [Peptococcaceae bacterium]|nr:MAG: 50S ribosomal protein L21 [Peptococcaceae bacterium]